MTEETTTKRDKIIEAIHDALPATTYDEITMRVRRTIRNVTKAMVNVAIAHLRRNVDVYGFTVNHVGASDDLTNRYFAIHKHRDGSYYFDENPQSIHHLVAGSRNVILTTCTMLSNHAVMLELASKHTRKINIRNRLSELAEDFAYLARKSKHVAEEVERDQEAA